MIRESSRATAPKRRLGVLGTLALVLLLSLYVWYHVMASFLLALFRPKRKKLLASPHDVSSEGRTPLLSFSELKEQDSMVTIASTEDLDFDDSRIFCDDADGFIDDTIEEQAQYFSYNWKRRSGRIALDARIAGETSTGQRSVPRTKTSTVKKTPIRLDLDIIYEDTPIRDGADLPNDDAAFPTCSTAKKGCTKMDLDFLLENSPIQDHTATPKDNPTCPAAVQKTLYTICHL
ncbi:hypothetical protein QR680_006390 [Steinernema hermaphroditum]|uniref:Uncharacterized protein n=1 Tax=Steinernema hermaphroditum TaxID=289476 RepID=A0AA39LX23_9BILA|nr:hypothetical protein QR680_006390 [Steinernema hermaphroditum]